MSDDRDDAKRAILSRRRKFLTVALATAGVATASCDKSPMVCLKVAPADDGGEPQVCLSAPMPPEPPDAGTEDAGEQGAGGAKDASADDGAADDAGAPDEDAGKPDGGPPPVKPVPPRVCLKYAPPRPCLTPVKPKKKG